MKKTISLIVSVLLCLCLLAACGGEKNGQTEHSFVKMSLEEGDFIIELYPEVAPKTVKHFLETVKSGYYDGKVFHRTIPGLIQGGSADGFGVGGTGKTVKGEFTENGFENNLKHERGVISMARTNDPNSASAQFFIMTTAQPYLDGNYATFGRVVEGIEIADRIAAGPTRGINNDELVEKPVIVKAEILESYTPSVKAE
ncbi:MAG: peptidylprolyl isomerase [Ruminococcaceae bacterium]|nr:peptidylprolyl isomerase [Oscillospiraceae bacterium]